MSYDLIILYSDVWMLKWL